MIIVLSDEQVDALKNDQLIEAASSIDIKAGEISELQLRNL